MPSKPFTGRDGQSVGVRRGVIAHAGLWHETANQTIIGHLASWEAKLFFAPEHSLGETMGLAMKVREAIQGLQEIRGILTKKERCFSDVMAKRAADGRGLTDEEVLTAVRLLRKYGISRREDGGPADIHMGGGPPSL